MLSKEERQTSLNELKEYEVVVYDFYKPTKKYSIKVSAKSKYTAKQTAMKQAKSKLKLPQLHGVYEAGKKIELLEKVWREACRIDPEFQKQLDSANTKEDIFKLAKGKPWGLCQDIAAAFYRVDKSGDVISIQGNYGRRISPTKLSGNSNHVVYVDGQDKVWDPMHNVARMDLTTYLKKYNIVMRKEQMNKLERLHERVVSTRMTKLLERAKTKKENADPNQRAAMNKKAQTFYGKDWKDLTEDEKTYIKSKDDRVYGSKESTKKELKVGDTAHAPGMTGKVVQIKGDEVIIEDKGKRIAFKKKDVQGEAKKQ